jgi:hypothetical protein
MACQLIFGVMPVYQHDGQRKYLYRSNTGASVTTGANNTFLVRAPECLGISGAEGGNTMNR